MKKKKLLEPKNIFIQHLKLFAAEYSLDLFYPRLGSKTSTQIENFDINGVSHWKNQAEKGCLIKIRQAFTLYSINLLIHTNLSFMVHFVLNALFFILFSFRSEFKMQLPFYWINSNQKIVRQRHKKCKIFFSPLDSA